MDDQTIKVGHLISPKKLAKIKLESIINTSTRKNLIDLNVINPYKSLAEQHLSHLDLIIHRVHDYVNTLPGLDPDKYITNLIQETNQFNIKLLSPFEVIELLADRLQCMIQLKPLTLLTLKSFTLKLPPMLEISAKTPRIQVEEMCMRFNNEFLLLKYPINCTRPFIMKTTKCVYADEYRYKMCLYFNMDKTAIDGIMEYLEHNTIVLQPFYNHDGMLYKLFILGEKWHLETRRSIKNFNFAAHSNEHIHFLSNHISKSDSYSTALHDSNKETLVHTTTCDPFLLHHLSRNDIDILVDSIRKCINSPLLGIDMLMECNSKNLFIIDINYFPGYDGFAKSYDPGEAFIDMLLQYSKTTD